MALSPEARAPIWLTVASSSLVLALIFFAHKGGLLRVAIPACAVAVGLVLYRRAPIVYVQFTLWTWFVTPLLRRLVDYKFGFADQNFVLLAPILVTGIAGLALFRCGRMRSEVLPFLLCTAGVLYGFVVGLILHPSSEVIYGLFNWLAPVVFGLHIYLLWPVYTEAREAIGAAFLSGVLFMGGYGIYQYCAPPKWDIFWWESLPFGVADSFGLPVKYQIRVWSTLNAPAPFAGVMGTGLLMNLASRSKWKLPCNLAGMMAFVFSLSRTEWLAFVFGLGFMVYRGGRTFVVRTLIGVVALVVLAVPLLSIGSTQDVLVQRLQTLTHLAQDDSFRTRAAMYDRLTTDMIREPFGQGVSNAEYYDGYALDSGPLRFLLNLGFLGTAFYFAGLTQLLLRLIPKQRVADPVQVACGSVLLVAVVKLVSLSAFMNVAGAMVWACIGLGLAARRAHAVEPTAVPELSTEYAYAD